MQEPLHMRVVKRLTLGVMLFATGVCFEQASQGVRDLSEVLARDAWFHTDSASDSPSLSLEELQWAQVRRAPKANAQPTDPTPPPPPPPPPASTPEAKPAPASAVAAVELPLQLDAQPEATPKLAKRPRPQRKVEQPLESVPSVDPTLVAPEDAFRMALRYKRSALEHCYEQELKKQAAFDGFVVVSVSLSVDGRVTQAHVEEGTRRDAQVGACIVAQLRQLQLPRLTEEADLIVPIRLEAKKPT